MLLVKTKIQTSPIAGIGLYADEFIPKDTVVWKLMPGFDTIHTEDEIKQLSPASLQQFMNYCYHDKFSKKYVLCFDDARFFNHSDNPNTLNVGDDTGITIASRDIQIGEELTTDYYEYEADPKKEKGV